MRLRPYKPCDAAVILSWVKDEDTFRKWVTDRYPHYPITAEEMNEKYFRFNGDCTEPGRFPGNKKSPIPARASAKK